ncbi:TonB family protein [Shewanella fidelis]|uniref:TonB family protein n=1 Tax=Shewanella fidelis TaxID=173509 RepID=A0AAW8NGY8_9GAMM|nr:TonB family protein [Shewanella fidelis]MDR8522623.1 TonB family protein [Shewanella fidelis]MDW4812239.1 TonB family protein [Shewanella fidelis]MDW4816097.1 TonB family protein [Shewanella fidelis]MDW4820480.1 TonB family protein [Shewanella fidelis]MDW4824702.1 TonB family protein [Shewanella fidelis]
MTPKRYFAFGCLTVLIQGAVLASQNSEAELSMNAGSAMGSNNAVSVSIAMQASQAAQPAPTKPELIKTPKKQVEKPVTKAEPVKPTPKKIKPTKVNTPPKATQIAKQQPQQETKPINQPTAEDTIAKEVDQTTSELAQTQSHDQAQLDAKQGVSQQSITLSRPTFAVPPSQPHYPKKARKRGFQGTATIEVMFNQLGEQLSLTLVDSSGYSLLDKAALNAVEKWQFAAPSPQTAYAYTVRVPVKFALN